MRRICNLKALIINGSPRPAGTTDTLVRLFAEALRDNGASPEILCLRDYKIIPCMGCEVCASVPFSCVLEGKDDTAFLYGKLFSRKLSVFASPIFFYGLPAHFKGFIDRSQRYWHKWQSGFLHPTSSFALCLLVAGRKKGAELFSGALRTLRWYGKPLNMDFIEPVLFRGLDSPEYIIQDSEINGQLNKKAALCAALLKKVES